MILALSCQGDDDDDLRVVTSPPGEMTSEADGAAPDDTAAEDAAEQVAAFDDFYRWFQSGADYDPVTSAEAVGAADLIALGRVVDVAEGRAFRTELRTGSRDVEFTLVVVEVSQLLKGAASDGRVYFEVTGPASGDLEEVRRTLPKENILVLLTPSPTPAELPENTTILSAGEAYPTGVHERTIQTPQLWLTERRGRVISPLVPDAPVIFAGEALNEVANEIERLVAGQP